MSVLSDSEELDLICFDSSLSWSHLTIHLTLSLFIFICSSYIHWCLQWETVSFMLHCVNDHTTILTIDDNQLVFILSLCYTNVGLMLIYRCEIKRHLSRIVTFTSQNIQLFSHTLNPHQSLREQSMRKSYYWEKTLALASQINLGDAKCADVKVQCASFLLLM